MKQEKYVNKPPGGGDQKPWVKVKDPSCSLIMGAPTKELDEPPYPGLILFQTSTQQVLQTKPINENMKKGNARKIYMGDTILAAAADVGTNEHWCLLDN